MVYLPATDFCLSHQEKRNKISNVCFVPLATFPGKYQTKPTYPTTSTMHPPSSSSSSSSSQSIGGVIQSRFWQQTPRDKNGDEVNGRS
jgi:hypothetical protein